MTAELIERGFKPVGKGGWRGKWRSFQTVFPDVCYATRAEDGNIQAFLSFNGESSQKKFNHLKEFKEDIEEKLGNDVIWKDYESGWAGIILQISMPFSLTESTKQTDNIRQEIIENLNSLKVTLDPYLVPAKKPYFGESQFFTGA